MKSIGCVLAFCLCAFSTFAQFDCVRGDCREFHSACIYPDGTRYEGEFAAGKPHGLGFMVFPNGDRYIGNFKHSTRQGKGRMRYSNGDHYFGMWADNRLQGLGEMTYANGNHYDGTWMANAPHGSGKFSFNTGDRYEGDFASGMFHGAGKMYYADGSVYAGQWQYNQRHGQGTYTRVGEKPVTGWWAQDEFVSTQKPRDIKNLEEADTAFLRNCNLEYCLAGRGSFTYRNGTHYIGDFSKGIPEGGGKVYYTNGDKYEGGWVKHQPQGNGTMFYKSGQIVKAVWEQGRPSHIIESFESRRETTLPAPVETNVRIWAVVVGAAQYSHMPALRYTDDDAYQLYAYLKSPQGGALNDQQVRLLIDEDATKNAVLGAMQQMFQQADEDDVILFYFSGHGVQGAFLPIDFDGVNNRITHEEIKRMIEKSRAKHKIVIADACHSGGSYFLRSTTQALLRRYYSAFEESSGGTALLMSSKGEEFSLEDAGLRSGVFSHFFIKGLKGAADNDSSGIISIDEIYQYTYRNVRMYTGNVQSPLLMGTFDRRMPIGAVY